MEVEEESTFVTDHITAIAYPFNTTCSLIGLKVMEKKKKEVISYVIIL